MQLQVDKLTETRKRQLERLSKFQKHQIKENILDYQVESHISLTQLLKLNVFIFVQKLIIFLSLGQITLIIYNTVSHLLKVQQIIELSPLNEDNILINSELKVMFTNLHEEGHETYEQNIKNLIIIFHKLLSQYQELVKQQRQQDDQLITIYANKILLLLKSNSHLTKLKQFIQENVQNQKINDIFLDDQINKEQFDSIFKQQNGQSQVDMNEDGYKLYNKYIQVEIRIEVPIPPNETAEKQLQFQKKQNQILNNSVSSNSSNGSNGQYKVEGTNYSFGSQQNSGKTESSNGNENLSQIPDAFPNQVQSEIFQDKKSIIYDNNVSFSSVDSFQQISEKSEIEIYTEDQKIIVTYFKEKISQINDKCFRDNLVRFITKNYYDMNKEQAKHCMLNVQCYYSQFLSFFENLIKDQSFREYGLERLFNLFSIKRPSQDAQHELLLMEQQSGRILCEQQFQQWKTDYEKQKLYQ